MFKNRFLLIIGVLSLLLVTIAVSKPFSKASPETTNEATDFYQRHPAWNWTSNDHKVIIPVTGDSAFPDYYQRHPELRAPVEISIDTTDYIFRHPELLAPVTHIDLTDYYFRHPWRRSNEEVPGRTFASSSTRAHQPHIDNDWCRLEKTFQFKPIF